MKRIIKCVGSEWPQFKKNKATYYLKHEEIWINSSEKKRSPSTLKPRPNEYNIS